MLIARRVYNPSDVLATSLEEMAGNVAKSHFKCFDFQKMFHSADVFCTLSPLFVWLGFRLLCVYFAIHAFAVHLICIGFWEFKLSKPQRQRQRAPWLCTRAS